MSNLHPSANAPFKPQSPSAAPHAHASASSVNHSNEDIHSAAASDEIQVQLPNGSIRLYTSLSCG
ncbi:hypothetical protein L2089_04065 [Paenibacillus hunanensis]|uniref:hypothetical protein n=1 Tax=Paenibacillus hunanensis TaxID=539262 RepID=UPI002025F545|nr:hypothetical protein [Paenibacillus hunanensis]MCL9659846.1 hypothetical protein [Paenibacillus hunanensis]